MVSSVDGAAEICGTSRSIGGPADRKIVGVLRSLSDAVLVGATTVRSESYGPLFVSHARQEARIARGQSDVPRLAIVTSSLEFDFDSELFTHAVKPIIVTSASAQRTAGDLASLAEVVVAGEQTVDINTALDALRERGMTQVLCEGGPTLMAAVANAGLLDELCLTVGPILAGPGHLQITGGDTWDSAISLELLHALYADNDVFLRYSVRRM